MSHNFDHADAMAAVFVERGVLPYAWTNTEGSKWRRFARRFHIDQPVHSLAFTDGRQWDEHNGWRNSSVLRPAKVDWCD